MNSQIQNVIQQAGKIIFGKDHQIKLALACIISKGHILIEDLPGMGKTTLAHVLAHMLGLNYSRIQFTSDMLPADILGVSIFDREQGNFSFHQGPIFSQLILADEINRATPKTQSALLEAMEEQQVSIEGKTRPLPTPFFVIATQNPTYQIGTFPLPESQLDRFLMRIDLGYPERKAEKEILLGEDRRELIKSTLACLGCEELIHIQQQIPGIHVSENLVGYLQNILEFTRQSPHFINGLSPRAGIALLNSAKAWAFLENRDHVIPEDIQAVLPYVVVHRLKPKDSQTDAAQETIDLVMSVPIP